MLTYAANDPYLSPEEVLRLMRVLPPSLQAAIGPHLAGLENVFIEIGRPLRLHNGQHTLVLPLQIEYEPHYLALTAKLMDSSFKSNNRIGIAGTYHRIARKLDDQLLPMGLTLRIGRYIPGAAQNLLPQLHPQQNLLLLGPPGSGKTTLLRDIAAHWGAPERVGALLVVVDTSNEIGGEGRVPMPHLGAAQWMKVPDPKVQADVIRQAIRNHAPKMLMVDEIGYDGEVSEIYAAGRRGLSLVASAHARTLEQALQDYSLMPLFGLANTQQPTPIHPPVFTQVAVTTPQREIHFYPDVATAVRLYLSGKSIPYRILSAPQGASCG